MKRTARVAMVEGVEVRPDSIVLQNRAVIADPNKQLSRFQDAVWDLLPAVPDRHSANQSIHWNRYPDTFRLDCKIYAYSPC